MASRKKNRRYWINMRPLIIFESPQFKNISLERKAALYRERAAKTRVRGATTAAGTMAGMTFGATAGMAMTAFSSPAARCR